uniref:Uncharacterized protein n=1 Tax=Micrurus lemniscatus lemniscatus TaxID=129467 RepID=A0A2D4IWK8_MICLE
MLTALFQQTAGAERDEKLGSKGVSVQVTGQRKRSLQDGDQQEPTGSGFAMPTLDHLKENSRRHRHPVQLDLEGGTEGEVAMVVTAAPLQPVRAVVYVHVQGHRPLFWHCGSCPEKSPREGMEERRQSKWEAFGNFLAHLGSCKQLREQDQP